MAAPATPSRKLPKSNFHTANTTSAEAPVTGPDAGRVDANPAPQTNDDFTHPDHVIPPRDYTGFENLVIVCCHAIFHPDASSSEFPLHSPCEEKNWHLAPFQRSNPETGKPGEHETFVAHALAGIDVLKSELSPHVPDKTLLVFSGGATKSSLTSLSEARSYYHAALAQELAQGNHGGGRAHQLFSRGKILLEEHATDSFQNLLFSILLFRRTTGRYPKQVRIITHAFKAKRFLDLHAPTIRWPADRIQVQGIDPVMSGAEREETVKGEEKFGYAPWVEDPLGTGEVLAGKRRNRGWDERVLMQLTEGLEMTVDELFSGTVPEQLPWSAA
ncbi:hypothetical protein BU23DRAFT_61589 [Bimuria novae-zelandiae CBS 107.79]|uniref:DUF218 domain-containing protein n=1 Tax=Bimuria novae-zelandiae CBS 107.79 TaxID=1447943 RepID=A0A6A5UI39_9PLEO|nr:hypothetical protein BU23DRAFT_61589 [Bimuria novae-zelandiae CBS 107.79]